MHAIPGIPVLNDKTGLTVQGNPASEHQEPRR
jgi:hypothetical protein